MSAFYDIARNPWPAVPRPEKGDERHLSLLIHAEVLTALLEVRESDETLQAKREDDAAGMLDSMQALLDVTDHTSPSRRTIIYVMIKLAAASRKFPSSIYVRDIDVGQVRDPARLGGYADIFEASHRGRPVALKRLRALTTRESDLHKNLCREALVWRQLEHPFILPFIGIDDNTFAEAGFISLVSPWMRRGTLKQYMNTADYNAGRDLGRLLVEAAEGLEYLHAQKVVHGDVKDLNVLIDDECHIRLCDFGLVIVGDGTEGRMTTTARGVGSGTWQSPERFLGERHRRTMGDDVYAFGCLGYYLMTGYPPFHELNEVGAAMKIINGQRPERPTMTLCSNALWTLVTDCWNHDPQSRPTMTSVLSCLLAGTLSEKGRATRKCGQPHPTASNDAWYSQSSVASLSVSRHPSRSPARPITKEISPADVEYHGSPHAADPHSLSSGQGKSIVSASQSPPFTPDSDQRKGWILGFLRRLKPVRLTPESPTSLPDDNISMPWNFQHHLHVDESMQNLPRSWVDSLSEAGYSEEYIAALRAGAGPGHQSRPVVLAKPRSRDSWGPAPAYTAVSASQTVPTVQEFLNLSQENNGDSQTAEALSSMTEPLSSAQMPAGYRGWVSEVVAPLRVFIDDTIDPRARYVDLQEIGEGESGSTVFCARVVDVPTTSTEARKRRAKDTSPSANMLLVAIKSMPMSPGGSPKIEELRHELDLMQRARNVHILTMDMLYVDFFEDSVWIRMELMETSLADIIGLADEGAQLTESLIARFAEDALTALEYLQSIRIAHRDVRSDNMLLNREGFLKLADFSAAIRVEPTDKPCTDVVGVIYWQAPEVRDGSYDPLKVDVFSLGATVWEMAQHEPPFVTVQDVSQVEAQWPPLDKPDDFTFDFHHFLRACSMVAHCRPAPNDLLTTLFIRSAAPRRDVIQILEKCRLIEERLYGQRSKAVIS